MSHDLDLLGVATEELFESAPCGFVITEPDGTIVRVNRTFEALIGRRREDLVGCRFRELLTAGGGLFLDTRVTPMLDMGGAARDVALDLVRGDGGRQPAIVNATSAPMAPGWPGWVRLTVVDGSDRRRHEQELARARDRDHEIARRLQESLLAGALPQDPGWELGVEYRPALEGLDVGGDWYDAFWTGERRVAVAVGDVVGRGLDAAAVMGQLRSALRAIASVDPAPASVLQGLDRYVERHAVGAMTTVAYGELDLDTGQLRTACAGHPPIAILQPGGAPSYVAEGRSAPLGAYASPRERDETTCRLAPGAVAVLFSDGLVERRDLDLDSGLRRVLDEVDARRDAAVDELAAGLRRAMEHEGARDDVCVVVFRRTGR